MVNENLCFSYLKRSRVRIDTLKIFITAGDYPDVIREAQEIVELLQKAILIYIGVDPPKWHDVGSIIDHYKERFHKKAEVNIFELVKGSQWLRSQRELAFYGAPDFIPEDVYTKEDALKAKEVANKYLEFADKIIKI